MEGNLWGSPKHWNIHRAANWQPVRRPIECRSATRVGYRTETVKATMSPACVGSPAGLRVAVLVRHQGVADWAPSQRAFLPLIVRR
jgi:hypothetical protein